MSQADYVVEIDVGERHTCSIKSDKVIRCWGYSEPIAEGQSRLEVPPAPDWVRQSRGGFRWKRVSTGAAYTCGILEEDRLRWSPLRNGSWDLTYLEKVPPGAEPNRTLLCWGNGKYGQRDFPVHDQWDMLDAGQYHVCAIMANATLKCWGENWAGQCDVPANPSGWKLVSAGQSHTCAIDARKRLFCWGDNRARQAAVPCEAYWALVTTGSLHSCGITIEGRLLCWGANDMGQLNVPLVAGGQWVEVYVHGGDAADAARSAGESHTCAVKADRSVMSCLFILTAQVHCWGANEYGQTTIPAGVVMADCEI